MQRHTCCLAIGPLRFLLRRHGNFGSSLQSCFVTPDGFVPKFFNLGCAFFHLSISMRLHAQLQFPNRTPRTVRRVSAERARIHPIVTKVAL